MKKKSTLDHYLESQILTSLIALILYFSGSVGLLAQIVFVVLKLLNKISWNWVWVLSPVWIYFGISAFMCLVAFFIVLIQAILEVREKEKKDNNG